MNEDEDDAASVSGQDTSVLNEAVGVENLDEVAVRVDGVTPDTCADKNKCVDDISIDLDCVCGKR